MTLLQVEGGGWGVGCCCLIHPECIFLLKSTQVFKFVIIFFQFSPFGENKMLPERKVLGYELLLCFQYKTELVLIYITS